MPSAHAHDTPHDAALVSYVAKWQRMGYFDLPSDNECRRFLLDAPEIVGRGERSLSVIGRCGTGKFSGEMFETMAGFGDLPLDALGHFQ